MEEDTFYDSIEEPLTLQCSKKDSPKCVTDETEDPDLDFGNANEITSPRSIDEVETKYTKKSLESRNDSKSVSFFEINQRGQQPKKHKKRINFSTNSKFYNSYLEMYQAKKKGSMDADFARTSKRGAFSDNNLPTDELYFRESKNDSESMHDTLFINNKSLKVNDNLPSQSPSKSSFTCSASSFSSRPATPSVLKTRGSGRNICSRNSSKLIKIPELGGLGPDVSKEKLTSFRKRISYGKSVSDKNRSKLEEKKLLKTLQQEINECKNA